MHLRVLVWDFSFLVVASCSSTFIPGQCDVGKITGFVESCKDADQFLERKNAAPSGSELVKDKSHSELQLLYGFLKQSPLIH